MAETLLQFVPKIGQVGLISSLVLSIATQAQQIVGLGVLPHLVVLLSILVCVLIGEVMMIGEAAEMRRALTISTAIRNVALGLLIVGANYPGTPAVAIVIVFGILSLGGRLASSGLVRTCRVLRREARVKMIAVRAQ